MNSHHLASPENLVIPIILCGGSGTRLWPLSRADLPKQFLALSANDAHHSLFQQAITRVNAIGEKDLNHDWSHEVVLGPTIVVTNEEHRFLVLDQLSVSNDIDAILLLEPTGRNTAPALTLAALQATNLESVKSKLNLDQIDPILVVTPADQAIQNQAAFMHAIQNCIKVVEADKTNRTIAMLGITPSSPETGYGYIKRNHEQGIYDEYAVDQFVEKPNVELAKSYLQDGSYLWNSGIFVIRASTWLAAIHEFRPDILRGAQDAWQSRLIDRIENAEFVRPSADIFKAIPADSIDYAVIEKCPHSANYQVKMLELNAGWNDLGAWDAVWHEGQQDHQGNVMIGDVIAEDSKNSLFYSSTRLLGAVGVEDLIAIETADISRKSKEWSSCQAACYPIRKIGST
jgi:mannose-1-phosphate guanylyltransferase / mannose-6-phosphate isomerase